METEGHPGLENLLARMDQEKAWEYEQKAKQILSPVSYTHLGGGGGEGGGEAPDPAA